MIGLEGGIGGSSAPTPAVLSSPISSYGPVLDAPRMRAGSTTGATGSIAVINKPVGTVAADQLLVFMWVGGGTLPTTPSGWLLLGSQVFSSGSDKVAIYARIVGLVDPASYSFAFGGSTTWRAAIGAWTGTVGTPSVTFATDILGTTHTAPAGTYPNRGSHLIVTVKDGGAGSVTTPGGYAKKIDGSGITVLSRHIGGAQPFAGLSIASGATDLGVTAVVTVEHAPVVIANQYETGDLQGFTQVQELGPAAPTILTDPTTFSVSGTRKVAQFDVLAGQKRSELMTGGSGGATTEAAILIPGDDVYFASAYWLPPDYPTPDSWCVVRQWKADKLSDAVSPSVALSPGSYNEDKWLIIAAGWPRVGGGEGHSIGVLRRGVWTKFVIRIKFSTTPANAIVQVWMAYGNQVLLKVFDSGAKVTETLNAQPVETRAGWWPQFAAETPGTDGATSRLNGIGSHERHGIYRDPANTNDAHILCAGTRWGSTIEEATV